MDANPERVIMTEILQKYKKVGWLLVFCGIWNVVLGFLYGFGFIFSSFDIGDGYKKVGSIYKGIAHNISWLGMLLFGIGAISSALLIIGGVLLLSSKMNRGFSFFGLCGMYLYFASFSVMTVLLSLSGGAVGVSFIWIGIALIILGPTFFLHRILKVAGR